MKEDVKELKKLIESVKDELRQLSAHEKLYVAAIGLIGTIMSTCGAIGGVVIAQMWK